MNYKKAVWVVGGLAVLFFIAAIIGLAVNGSHRWVEPMEELGWICFVVVVAIEYLFAREPAETQLADIPYNIAWTLGLLAVIFLIAALMANAISTVQHGWMEALEVAGLFCMVGMVLIGITMRRQSDRRENR